MTNIQDNQGEYGTNCAYLLWIDGKPSKVSSDKKCLIPHANQALDDGFKADVTFHQHHQECFDLVESAIDLDDWMNDSPNPNRFVKSSFALSLIHTASFFGSIYFVKTKNTALKDLITFGYIASSYALRSFLNLELDSSICKFVKPTPIVYQSI